MVKLDVQLAATSAADDDYYSTRGVIDDKPLA